MFNTKSLYFLLFFIVLLAVFHEKVLELIPNFRHPVTEKILIKKTIREFPIPKTQDIEILAGDQFTNDSARPIKFELADKKAVAYVMPGSTFKLPIVRDQIINKNGLILKKGKIRLKFKKLGFKETFRIKTPSAVAGVRGTIFSLDHQESGHLQIRVPEGSVALKGHKTSSETLINTGMQASLSQQGKLQSSMMSQEEMLNEMVLFRDDNYLQTLSEKYKSQLEKAWPNSSQHFRLFGPDSALLVLDRHPGIHNLFPLRGIPLVHLSLAHTSVKQVNSLANMKIIHLNLWNTKVQDIKPLQKMSLVWLNLENTLINTIAPLKGKSLSALFLGGTKIEDISILEGMPMEHLTLWGTKIKDISALQNMPLTWLSLAGTKISDIQILSNIHSLKSLALNGTNVKDLTPIKSLKLTHLIISPDKLEQGWVNIVRNIKSLKVLASNNSEFEMGMTPKVFWDKYIQN